MPEESYDDIRRLIGKLLPRFVGRDIIDGKICWCTGKLLLATRVGEQRKELI